MDKAASILRSLAILAGIMLAAFVAYEAYKGWRAVFAAGGKAVDAAKAALSAAGNAVGTAVQQVNPANPDNFVNRTFTSGVQTMTGDKGWTLGGWLYDVFHPAPASQKAPVAAANQDANGTDIPYIDTQTAGSFNTFPPVLEFLTPGETFANSGPLGGPVLGARQTNKTGLPDGSVPGAVGANASPLLGAQPIFLGTTPDPGKGGGSGAADLYKVKPVLKPNIQETLTPTQQGSGDPGSFSSGAGMGGGMFPNTFPAY